MIDAFLELYDANGQLVAGESSDEAFPHRIELLDFSMGDGSVREDGDDADEVVAASADDADKKMQKVIDALDRLSAGREPAPAKAAASAMTDAKQVAALITQMKSDLAAGVKAKKEQPEPAPEAKGPEERLTFNVSKDLDSASADLFQAYCWAKAPHKTLSPRDQDLGRFSRAVVTLRKMFGDEPHPYLVCTFQDVQVVSYQVKFDGGRAHLGEEVTFKFVSYKVQYQAQTAAGTEGRVYITDGTIGGKANPGRG